MFLSPIHEHDYGVCALIDSLFRRLEFAFSGYLDDTYYLPSVILIPFGLWSFTTASSTSYLRPHHSSPGRHGDPAIGAGTHRFPRRSMSTFQGPFGYSLKIFFFPLFIMSGSRHAPASV